MAFGREGGTDSGSRADGAPAPHWMKLLEEKYQRLHAKIVNGTSKFTFKRNPSLLSGPALRKAREARRVAKQNATNAQIDGDYAGRSCDPQADEVCLDETNEPERSYRNSDSRANFNDTRYSLSTEGQHVSIPGAKQKKVCYESSGDTRQPVDSEGAVDCAISHSATPFTSGTVTRIPSSVNFTRLSSAVEYNEEEEEDYDEVFHQVINERAAELSSALNSHLQDVGHDERENSSDENEVSAFFEYKNTIISGEDDEFLGTEAGDVKCHTARDGMEVSRGNRRRRANRQVKTSVSRVSLKTTKSCPANFFDAHDALNNNHNDTRPNGILTIPQSVLPLTSRGVQESRMRVFARMSLEARHAIDEMRAVEEEEKPPIPQVNIREVTEDGEESDWPTAAAKPAESGDQLDDVSLQNNFSGVDGGKVTKEDDKESVGAESDMSIPSNNDNTTQVVPNHRTATRVSNIANSSRDDFANNNSSVLLPTSNRRNAETMSKSTAACRKLPQMERHELPLSQSFPNPHSRLPDIGQSYLSFRENTFEITPPDFDIRFHQIIPCSQGERDTPPLDVRQHAIEKCEQWLVRHTPRR